MHHKNTPVDRAFLDCMRAGAFEMAHACLSMGADVNATDPRHGHKTALHWAAKRGSLRAIDLLISAGADRRARDDMSRTPEDVARQAGCGMGTRKLRA